MRVLDDAWESWLTLNINRGCTAESMIEAMVKAGFDPRTASAVVHRSLQEGAVPDDNARAHQVSVARDYRYDLSPVASGNVIHADGRDVKVLMRCERPRIIVFGDVLSADECEAMIERSRDRLQPSTTVNPDTGTFDVIPNRTSRGIWFQRGEDEFIARLEARFASLMNAPVENGEGLQVLHYEIGQEYRPHFDYFPPGQAGSNVHLASGGQRVATLIVYLSDVEAGGQTIFPEIGLSVAPNRGGAVYFHYLNGAGQVDPMTLHGGAPVVSGEKWIMTKWVRERAYV
jgi:prolyl 4-hydroxylase